MAEQRVITWYTPAESRPRQATTIIVDYGGVSFSGVYNPQRGEVVRYPEDFPPVKLDACSRWCHLPVFVPEQRRRWTRRTR